MRISISVFCLLFPVLNFCQGGPGKQVPGNVENHANIDSSVNKSQIVRIVFYNLENLYDPYDDTTKLDDDFTSKGTKRWNFSRFLIKLNHISKTFMAIGGWEPPAMIGMCEVENRYVLNKMINETPLKKYKYSIIHYESPDARGIDVALLYHPAIFKVLFSRNIRIRNEIDSSFRTRDILYVKGILFSLDTVHVFVNHWPSRYGGFNESVPKRRMAAGVLRSAVDTLQHNHYDPQIIIMGDFNDDPDQPAITEVLNAGAYSSQTNNSSLVNLMLPKMKALNEGTHKFQGKWAILDQFMVSGNFLLQKNRLRTSQESAHIFHSGFLTEDDERFLGGKPLRTYSGPRYTGGFSDHFPVYLEVWKRER